MKYFSFIKIIPFIALLTSSSVCLYAQTDSIPSPPPIDEISLLDSLSTVLPDSLVQDTSAKKKFNLKDFKLKEFLKRGYPDPNKAALLSLLAPGAGQAYNKKYWKMPIVYAGIGTTIYFAVWHETRYRFYRDNYLYRVDLDDSTTADLRLSMLSDETIKTIRNRYDKRRQQLYAGTLAVWLLQAMDAYVDAHLKTFDVDEDLTLEFRPTLNTAPYYGHSVGVGVSLEF